MVTSRGEVVSGVQHVDWGTWVSTKQTSRVQKVISWLVEQGLSMEGDNIPAIERVFPGLSFMALSREEQIVVRDLFERYMKIDEQQHPYVQEFFTLANEQVNPIKKIKIQADEQKHSLKTILFNKNKKSYIAWISQIINEFEIYPHVMIHLITVISSMAEPDEKSISQAELLRIKIEDQ